MSLSQRAACLGHGDLANSTRVPTHVPLTALSLLGSRLLSKSCSSKSSSCVLADCQQCVRRAPRGWQKRARASAVLRPGPKLKPLPARRGSPESRTGSHCICVPIAGLFHGLPLWRFDVSLIIARSSPLQEICCLCRQQDKRTLQELLAEEQLKKEWEAQHVWAPCKAHGKRNGRERAWV